MSSKIANAAKESGWILADTLTPQKQSTTIPTTAKELCFVVKPDSVNALKSSSYPLEGLKQVGTTFKVDAASRYVFEVNTITGAIGIPSGWSSIDTGASVYVLYR